MSYDELSDQIIKRICDCGWRAYLTGGAVRDSFMNLEPDDYDIVTDATPEELTLIFPERKVRTVGASFLVTLVDDIEVATYRSDKNYKPGRSNCVTEVCKTLDEDLQRRDFTFNAMAVCPYTGEVVDPFNGRKDLERKVVKFVGDPNLRIYEDYLRMIRAARFACLIEGNLDQTAFIAISKNKDLVKQISHERIRLEFLKVMKYKKPSIFFDILHETGILKILLPELDVMYGHTGGRHHAETLDVHFKTTGDSLSPKNKVFRFIGYLHDIGKVPAYTFNEDLTFINHENLGSFMIEKIFKKYKFIIKETEFAKGIVLMHLRSVEVKSKDSKIRKLLKDFSENKITWKDWLRLRIADRNANFSKENYSLKDIKDICLKIHRSKTWKRDFSIRDLDISGHDIMNNFDLTPGPQVGYILKKLFEIVIDNPTMNTREKLLELVKENKGWVQSSTN